MNHSSAAAETINTTDLSDLQHFFRLVPPDQERLLAVVFSTILHFSGDAGALFEGIEDPQEPNKTDYPLAALAFAGILMFLLCLQARRQVGLLLRTRGTIETFKALFDISGFPHSDTLDHGFSRLSPQDMQEVVSGMLRKLIVKKSLDSFRLLDKYFVVAGDGTGTLSFHKRHCAHCLTRKHNGKTLYYHIVLETKLVTSNGPALSLMTQFVENSAPNSLGEQLGLGLIWIRNEIRFVISSQALPNTKTPLPITLRLHKLTEHILKNRVPHKGVAKARLKLPPKVNCQLRRTIIRTDHAPAYHQHG